MGQLWAIVVVSVGIGLALVGPILWRHRREIRRSWADGLGFIAEGYAQRSIQQRDPHPWVTVALLSASCIGIAFLLGIAVSLGGAVAWTVCAVLIVALVILFNAVLLARIG